MTGWIGIGGLVAVGAVLAAGVAVVVAAFASFRAGRGERQRSMPGDSIVRDPMYVVTQAVTIDAPAEHVWPWLAQMGAGRAGWYSYDRVDNGGRPSATSILPRYQGIAAGDVMPAIPGATDAFIVAEARPPFDLILTVPAGGNAPIVSWEFLLERQDDARTRLIVRGRVSPSWVRMTQDRAPAQSGPIPIERAYSMLGRLPRPLLLLAGGIGHRVMQHRQLRGIKLRAERGNDRPTR